MTNSEYLKTKRAQNLARNYGDLAILVTRAPGQKAVDYFFQAYYETYTERLCFENFVRQSSRVALYFVRPSYLCCPSVIREVLT